MTTLFALSNYGELFKLVTHWDCRKPASQSLTIAQSAAGLDGHNARQGKLSSAMNVILVDSNT